MLAKRKLNNIETLVPQALIDMEMSHEEFNAVISDQWEPKMWEDDRNVRNVNEKQENMRLNSVNSRKITSL